jgi:dual specificity MAP kinase phosphatase
LFIFLSHCWLESAREQNTSVYVHCRAGISRSATVVIAYVMKILRLPLPAAFSFVRARRTNLIVQPNEQLMKDLLEWEVHVFGTRQLSWPDLVVQLYKINVKTGNPLLYAR